MSYELAAGNTSYGSTHDSRLTTHESQHSSAARAILGIGVALPLLQKPTRSALSRLFSARKADPPKYLPTVRRLHSCRATQEMEARPMRVLQCTKRSVTLLAAAC